MSKKIISLPLMILLFFISCEDQFQVKQEVPDLQDTQLLTPGGKATTPGVVQASTCGGSFSGSYSVISSYHTYPSNSFDVTCAASGATISVSCSAADVPNRFTIRDASNNYVTSSGWLGNAAYGGPWGSSLPPGNPSNAIITFPKSTNTYYLVVETLTPPNYSYTPNTDFWSATISCTCTTCSPSCPAGYVCVNGNCVCATSCGGSFDGSYSVISSYYTYPTKTFNTGCLANGATISVSCSAVDVPNRFTIRDASNNYVTSSGWLGNAAYGGPWGSSLPPGNPSNAVITFSKAGSSYKLIVETLTPPNYSYTPNTDYWSAYVSCP